MQIFAFLSKESRLIAFNNMLSAMLVFWMEWSGHLLSGVFLTLGSISFCSFSCFLYSFAENDLFPVTQTFQFANCDDFIVKHIYVNLVQKITNLNTLTSFRRTWICELYVSYFEFHRSVLRFIFVPERIYVEELSLTPGEDETSTFFWLRSVFHVSSCPVVRPRACIP